MDNNVLRLFGLGHSHIHALLRGASLLRSDEKISVEGICLRDEGFRNLPRRGLDSAAAHDIKNRAANADAVFLCIQGNQHNTLALVESGQAVDFYHPDLPQVPIRENALVLPYRTIWQLFEDALETARAHFVFLKRLLDKPLIQCQPPPPNPSEAHIRQNPGAFGEALARFCIAPKSFRLKMWKVQCDVMRRMCEDAGILFLPCPDAALDDEGFLVETAWGRDPTHASADYGALVIRQLARAVRAGDSAIAFHKNAYMAYGYSTPGNEGTPDRTQS